MVFPKFELELVPGDKSTLVHDESVIFEMSSSVHCKVTVEVLPPCSNMVLRPSRAADKQAFEAPFPPVSTIPLSHSSF